MNIEAINSMRLCSNAKPPINHDIKHAQEAEISEHVAKFLANGGEIEVLESNVATAKVMTFKQVNDSTYVGGL